MSTYRNAKRDTAIADDYLAQHMSCRYCGAMTDTKELSALGARCRPCFNAYQAEANPAWWPNRALTADERKAVVRKATQGLKRIGAMPADPKGWARDLRSCESRNAHLLPNGTRMTDAHRDAWRWALRYETELETNGGLE